MPLPVSCQSGTCGAGLFSLVENLLVQNNRRDREELPALCRLSSLIVSADDGGRTMCPSPENKPYAVEKPVQGDLVILGFGFGVHPEYQSCSAVITRVDEQHCMVAVLDPSRGFRTGDCQVAFRDLRPVHQEWRAGARLVIGGLQSSKMRHLNGRTVHVCEHRRYGHPCFVQPSASQGTKEQKDKLTLCVRLDDPIPDHATALLLEPRFLSPYIPKEERAPTVPKLCLPAQKEATGTLLSSSRSGSSRGETDSKNSPVSRSRRVPSTVETARAPPAAPSSCSGGFLGLLSWLVEAQKSPEEEHPTVCRSASIITVDEESPKHSHRGGLLPIPELAPGDERILGDDLCGGQVPEQGDLVILGRGVNSQYQLCSAVIKEVHADFCSVAVLDASRSFSTGECIAKFREVIPVHQDWRVGTRLVVGGLQSSHMRHLNGLYARVCPHKRFGHPCLIQKPSAANGALWLTLCVRFEDSSKSSIHGALLEPRFLTPCSATPLERWSSQSMGRHGQPFPRAASAVSESTLSSSSSSYQKSLSMPGTPASSVSTLTRSTSHRSDSDRSEHQSSKQSVPTGPMHGMLGVSFQKPRLPTGAHEDDCEDGNPQDPEAPRMYQKQSSLSSTRSTASSISYQKSASLPSSASGRSGRGIPLARMEQEVKDLRAMLKVLANKSQEPTGAGTRV
mmetsp:Transcript_28969/g.68890  ORF Transcript_28969/g.68890 Transcript_28969/m.68890 type:complete len:678 (-) Transcript_28969:97-2130(-)